MADLKLLLVDDELEFLEPLCTRLGRRGVACTVTLSGEEALKALAAGQFDCAVVDVKMPGMDGLELLRRMRRDFPGTAVVLLTGHASVELGVQGMELGAFDYLLKPIDLDELLDTVRRAAAQPARIEGPDRSRM
ncbi:MAG: response regulator [Acidobacteriota bacterium]